MYNHYHKLQQFLIRRKSVNPYPALRLQVKLLRSTPQANQAPTQVAKVIAAKVVAKVAVMTVKAARAVQVVPARTATMITVAAVTTVPAMGNPRVQSAQDQFIRMAKHVGIVGLASMHSLPDLPVHIRKVSRYH